jgi:threonine synthase
MSYVRCLRGLVSGIEYSADAPMNLDPADGHPVEMVLGLERLKSEQPNASDASATSTDFSYVCLDFSAPFGVVTISTLSPAAAQMRSQNSNNISHTGGVPRKFLTLELMDFRLRLSEIQSLTNHSGGERSEQHFLS